MNPLKGDSEFINSALLVPILQQQQQDCKQKVNIKVVPRPFHTYLCLHLACLVLRIQGAPLKPKRKLWDSGIKPPSCLHCRYIAVSHNVRFHPPHLRPTSLRLSLSPSCYPEAGLNTDLRKPSMLPVKDNAYCLSTEEMFPFVSVFCFFPECDHSASTKPMKLETGGSFLWHVSCISDVVSCCSSRQIVASVFYCFHEMILGTF